MKGTYDKDIRRMMIMEAYLYPISRTEPSWS